MNDQIPAGAGPGMNHKHSAVTSNRVRAVTAIMILGLVGGFGAMVANLWFFIRDGYWQMLAVPVGILGAWALLWLANRQARTGNLELAGYLTIAGVMLGMGIGELFHAGLTVALAISGGIGILVAGAMTLPGQWVVWLVCLVSYGAYFWLVNALEPLNRFGGRVNVADIAPFQMAVIVIVISLVGMIIWQFVRILRFGKIRTRLLITFIVLVLLPAVTVGTISSVLNAQRAQSQVLEHLASVAALKSAEVQQWADALISNLLLAMPSYDQFGFTQMILAGPEYTEASVFQFAYERELNRFDVIIRQGRVFDEIFLVTPRGSIVLSTDTQRVGLNEYGYPYFDGGLEGPYVSPQYLSQQTNRRIITVAAPIIDPETDDVIGLIAGRVNLDRLEDIMRLSEGLGQTGETYLLARRDLRLLTVSRYPGFTSGESYPLFSEGIQQAAAGNNGQGTYSNYAGVKVFGAYYYLEDVDMILLAEQSRAESLTAVTQSIGINVLVTILVVVIAILGALYVTNRITIPIAGLAQTAEKIATGDLTLDTVVPHAEADEIGALAGSFNTMTARLRETLTGLEEQVSERTAALRQRSAYLLAASEVSRAVASVLDPDQLIQQVVELIQERFNLYYVGLFVVDEPREWAVLQAGTGDAGKIMLARNHRIQVGTGMIGWCVANRQSRVALRAELDDARLANPFLPDTRSEAAIPLRSRGRVIGALTVQSTQPEAFDDATVTVFETMADQVGVALDNARLFAESQRAYESLSRAYGEQTLAGWARQLQSRAVRGYQSDSSGRIEVVEQLLPETALVYEKGDVYIGYVPDGSVGTGESASQPGQFFLGVPVMVRDQMIGVIQGYKPADAGSWRTDEIEFMQDVANIVAITLENARLYEDTQQRAENERIIAEVSSRIRQSLDVDTVMQTAVVELQRTLGLKDVTIRLGEIHE